MCLHCKINAMRTSFFYFYGERLVQRLQYFETRICSPTKINLRLKVGRRLERSATLQNCLGCHVNVLSDYKKT